jgi:hypothetical protein
MLCLLIGAVLGQAVPEVSHWGWSALVYWLFTMVVLVAKKNWYVRYPLLVVNYVLFVFVAYLLWATWIPGDWPEWVHKTATIATGVLWGLGLAGFWSLTGLGKNKGTANMDDGEEELEGATMTIQEQMIAALKLAGHNGDLTVNVGSILESFALQKRTESMAVRTQRANAIMKAVESGFVPEAEVEHARRVACELLGVVEEEAEAESEEAYEATNLEDFDPQY